MADPEQLALLRKGPDAWNKWRETQNVKPDLAHAGLRGAHLPKVNLFEADLRLANLREANLARAAVQ
jgi:uncharacterized protein YjbI with pentapeptide repeats